MAPKYNYHDFLSHKDEPDIPGLTFVPSLVVEGDKKTAGWNTQDSINTTEYFGHGYTLCVQDVLKEEIHRLGDKLKLIVEIGVQHYHVTPPGGMKSYTETIIANKNPDTYYIGIDKNNKAQLDNPEQRVYTIQTDSSIREPLYELMETLDIDEIDMLHIDGWHSVNQVIDDWKYTERLADHGTVTFHDITYHPGPWAVFEAIDTEMYTKEKLCPGCYGIAVARRIQNG